MSNKLDDETAAAAGRACSMVKKIDDWRRREADLPNLRGHPQAGGDGVRECEEGQRR